MVKLVVRDRESIQEAVRRFRKLVERSGIKKEMRRREYYEKPSEVKRRADYVPSDGPVGIGCWGLLERNAEAFRLHQVMTASLLLPHFHERRAHQLVQLSVVLVQFQGGAQDFFSGLKFVRTRCPSPKSLRSSTHSGYRAMPSCRIARPYSS